MKETKKGETQLCSSEFSASQRSAVVKCYCSGQEYIPVPLCVKAELQQSVGERATLSVQLQVERGVGLSLCPAAGGEGGGVI